MVQQKINQVVTHSKSMESPIHEKILKLYTKSKINRKLSLTHQKVAT